MTNAGRETLRIDRERWTPRLRRKYVVAAIWAELSGSALLVFVAVAPYDPRDIFAKWVLVAAGLFAIAGGAYLALRFKRAVPGVEHVSIDDRQISIAGATGAQTLQLSQVRQLRTNAGGGIEVIDSGGRVAIRLSPDFTNLGGAVDALLERVPPAPGVSLPVVFGLRSQRGSGIRLVVFLAIAGLLWIFMGSVVGILWTIVAGGLFLVERAEYKSAVVITVEPGYVRVMHRGTERSIALHQWQAIRVEGLDQDVRRVRGIIFTNAPRETLLICPPSVDLLTLAAAIHLARRS